jgi:energy-coupling factor transporter ATP-binding protein EcfA2
MYVRQLRLTNITCFEDIHLDFMRADGHAPCRWVVLLGENGTGKSTILRMLAVALLGRDLIHHVAPGVQWGAFVRQGVPKGRLIVSVQPTQWDRLKGHPKQHDYHAVFDIGSYKTGLHQDFEPARGDADALDETLYSDKFDVGWFACGYGAWRRVPHREPRGRSHGISASDSKAMRFATLLDETNVVTRVSDWIADLDYRQLKSGADSPEAEHFALAIRTLESVFENATFKEVNKDREVLFHQNGADVQLDRLSDGYRSVAAFVGDLVMRLIETFPRRRDPLMAQGVVLIDELDAHLHPEWQGRIVEKVRELFPNLQFIVSSHSPFVAQDMRSEDKLIVLRRAETGVVHTEDPGDVHGWRVDQILTSHLFGLPSTRNAGVDTVEKRKRALVEKQTSSDLAPAERAELNEVREWLENKTPGPGQTEEEREVYNVARVFADFLERYATRRIP